MTRTERQEQCIQNWRKANGIGTIVAATGFGKTRISTTILQRSQGPRTALVVVPTRYLKRQWTAILETLEITNVKVEVINTVVSRQWEVDLLILDEYHCYASPLRKAIFDTVRYKFILGLTATIERLDGEHEYLLEKAPICDEIPLKECVANDWVAKYVEYNVMIDTDLTEYNKLNSMFVDSFNVFSHDFNLAMSIIQADKVKAEANAAAYARSIGRSKGYVQGAAARFSKAMHGRKNWIYSHPRKAEIANQILAARPKSKAVTFAKSIAMCKKIDGEPYHSKLDTNSRLALEKDFEKGNIMVLSTARAFDMGADVAGIELGIIIAGDSSPTTRRQRRGRCIRKEGDKTAELFNLVLKGTQDENWNRSSGKGSVVINIDEIRLKQILNETDRNPEFQLTRMDELGA